MTNIEQRLNKKYGRLLLLSRLSIGWLMFYAGITKVLNPDWSAAGYLTHAKTFTGFYIWFSNPGMIGITNFLNKWGLTLIGISLILGAGVRLSAMLGAIMMLLYYFPAVEFPYTDHGYIVDDHIIYAAVLLFFVSIRAGRYYGFDKFVKNPALKKFWG